MLILITRSLQRMTNCVSLPETMLKHAMDPLLVHVDSHH